MSARASWAASALLALAACGGPARPAASPAAPPAERPTTARSDSPEPPAQEAVEAVGGVRPLTRAEKNGLRAMMRLTERVRELPFLRPVRVEVETRERITARFLEDLEDEDLDDTRLAYVALGLLPPDVDLVDLLSRVLGEQVVGYYDTEADRLVVRDDVMPAMAGKGSLGGEAASNARLVVLHELVHALQDQHFDLDALEPEALPSDVALARRALVEGDATLAIVALSLEQLEQPLSVITGSRDALDRLLALSEGFDGGGDESAELRGAPAIVRESLVLPYTAGTRLVGQLHGRDGWKAIDAAFDAPPTSMEQVLHPEKYLAGEDPDAFEVPELPALTDAGWARLDVDTLGEAELGLYFGQGLPGDKDAAAAAGWSGDSLAVHAGPGGVAAAIWFTTWDDAAEATEAEIAANRVQGLASPADQRTFRTLRRGRALLVVRHLPRALHRPVMVAFDAFARALPAAPRP